MSGTCFCQINLFLLAKKSNIKPDITGKTIYFFGNSITYGYGASVPSNCWVGLLTTAKSLTAINKGVSGTMLTGYPPQYASPAMVNRLSEIPTYSSNLIIWFDYGINDSYLGRTFNTDSLTKYYTVVINNLISKGWPMKSVFIMDIYLYFSTNYANGPTTIIFNTAIKNLCKTYGINYIPIRQEMINAGFSTSNEISDHVHPNDSGYNIIFNGILKYIK